MKKLCGFYEALKNEKKQTNGWYFSGSVDEQYKKSFGYVTNYYYIGIGNNPPFIFSQRSNEPDVIVYCYFDRDGVYFWKLFSHITDIESELMKLFNILKRVKNPNKIIFSKEKICHIFGGSSSGQATYLGIYKISQELAKKANHMDSIVLRD